MYFSLSGRFLCTRVSEQLPCLVELANENTQEDAGLPGFDSARDPEDGASFLTMRINFESTLISLLACPSNRSRERSASGNAASFLLVRMTV